MVNESLAPQIIARANGGYVRARFEVDHDHFVTHHGVGVVAAKLHDQWTVSLLVYAVEMPSTKFTWETKKAAKKENKFASWTGLQKGDRDSG